MILDSLFCTRAPGDNHVSSSGAPCKELQGDPHYHKTPNGLVACLHKCKSCLTDLSFWIGVTVSFPLEHVIWEKIPPFNYIARYFGLL